MNDIVNFIYESGICLAILFSLYWFFLREETYFRFNRFYLLGTLIVACLLPLVNFSQSLFGPETSSLNIFPQMAEAIRLPEVTIAEGATFQAGHTAWQSGFLAIYLIGSALLLLRIILGMIKVYMLKRKGQKTCFNGYTIVHIKQKIAPFSFFKTIYINDALIDNGDKSAVISHELIHIRQKHTCDNLIVEILLAIFWFNPVMWLLRGALRDTHEYLADNGVINKTTSLTNYQTLLLKHLNGLFPIVVTNSFNSTIKKRIKMMYRCKSSVLAKLKPLLVIPILISLTLLFACSENPINPIDESLPMEMADEMIEITKPAEGMDNLEESDIVEEEIFYIVEEMPTFNGGEPAIEFRKYVSQNLRHPESSSVAVTGGRVIIQFAVNKEGNVVDAVVVRSVNPLLDKEAIRVVMSSPQWTPGKQSGKEVKVLFTFPINFEIN